MEKPQNGKKRVIVESLAPEIEGGLYPAKSAQGDRLCVRAVAYADGHDDLRGRLLYRHQSEPEWRRAPFDALYNDEWESGFRTEKSGLYLFTAEFWVDHLQTWVRDLQKKISAGQDVSVDLLIGADLIENLPEQNSECAKWIKSLRRQDQRSLKLEDLRAFVEKHPHEEHGVRYPRELPVFVERARARFSSWYEFFPRSSGRGLRHGTLRDAAEHLSYVASMGFNVVYLPPIHPIGVAFRKGKNNNVNSNPGEPGSPWAIGSREGGHKSVHPELGSLSDFSAFLKKSKDLGLEVALDLAFQCSPDHPYVREHPEWFKKRPDGTIQYAENPPKKYQDIYPFDFECDDWESLWDELKSVILFWVEQGVQIFRVDNPHTKSFRFWKWAIAEVKSKYPDVLFLSEAFTRPHIMYHLAKIGFSQSYTYFTWRVNGGELKEYLGELTQSEVKDFYRPNFWPNTPDILPHHLQEGGRPAFLVRLLLAATLSSNYGIYGPAYELCESEPMDMGKEEYLNSEKYEIRDWDLNREDSLRDFAALVNRIRNERSSLQHTNNISFHSSDNDQLLVYSKHDPEGSERLLIIVNLDWAFPQAGWTQLDLNRLGLRADEEFELEDLLTGVSYTWKGPRNFVRLEPGSGPGHIFLVKGAQSNGA